MKSQKMKDIIFEHPLTEKMRTWLRLEYLLKTIFETRLIETEPLAINHLKALIEISEVLERGDIKVDLYKDLDKLLAKFAIWADLPDVDQGAVKKWQDKLNHLSNDIKQVARFNTHLQNDKLLNCIRQRISIPGGYCNFDLPTLHVWLNLPKQAQYDCVAEWTNPLSLLNETISTIVSLTRHTGEMKQAFAKNGFYQDITENKELLRIQLKVNDLIFPQVSGVKNRFMIRFLPYDSDTGIVPDEFSFAIASC